MSNSISTLLTRNLQDVFGENDPALRRAAIDEIFTEDAVFYDPNNGVYREAREARGQTGRFLVLIRVKHCEPVRVAFQGPHKLTKNVPSVPRSPCVGNARILLAFFFCPLGSAILPIGVSRWAIMHFCIKRASG